MLRVLPFMKFELKMRSFLHIKGQINFLISKELRIVLRPLFNKKTQIFQLYTVKNLYFLEKYVG